MPQLTLRTDAMRQKADVRCALQHSMVRARSGSEYGLANYVGPVLVRVTGNGSTEPYSLPPPHSKANDYGRQHAPNPHRHNR